MATPTEQRSDPAPPALVMSAPYPVIRALRRNGPMASVAAGVVAFVLVLGSSRRKGSGAVSRAALCGVLVAVGVKNLSELNDIIADTLLPQ